MTPVHDTPSPTVAHMRACLQRAGVNVGSRGRLSAESRATFDALPAHAK